MLTTCIQHNTQFDFFFINVQVLQNVAASPAAKSMYHTLTQPCSHSGLQPQSLQPLVPPTDDVALRSLCTRVSHRREVQRARCSSGGAQSFAPTQRRRRHAPPMTSNSPLLLASRSLRNTANVREQFGIIIVWKCGYA